MERNLRTHKRPLSLILMSFIVLMLASCEKEVHINLASVPPSLVVQGQIETDEPPFVLLTTTMGFFSKIDLGTLQNTFVHDAVVKVSDGSRTVTLKEYTIDSSGYKFSFYTIDFLGADTMFGQENKIYTLTIDHNGKTYTARTKIPVPQGVDSMWFDVPEFAGENTPDSARQLFVNYTDPDTLGDYVRCYTDRNNEGFFYSSNFSDEIINGKKISKIGLAAGYQNDGTDNRNRDSLIYFFPGDSVSLKWCAVDKAVYNFWNTLDFAKGSVGNPFASPINPTTNLTNGALGVWAGYGTYYKRARVPH
ncbi:hypothetical protein GCM10023093_03950 [Nemorincola caseinilytica]|uniref:DUF4249 domain-containing protein n=1 Tax=Nemorincola caseinilytica TaxID=2054315 RepID=A0ABP8N3N1_9BACT